MLNHRFPRVQEVIITLVSRGAGTSIDPCRSVTMIFTKDGEFIAENDPLVVPLTDAAGERDK